MPRNLEACPFFLPYFSRKKIPTHVFPEDPHSQPRLAPSSEILMIRAQFRTVFRMYVRMRRDDFPRVFEMFA